MVASVPEQPGGGFYGRTQAGVFSAADFHSPVMANSTPYRSPVHFQIHVRIGMSQDVGPKASR
jgi:hypothetical protein